MQNGLNGNETQYDENNGTREILQDSPPPGYKEGQNISTKVSNPIALPFYGISSLPYLPNYSDPVSLSTISQYNTSSLSDTPHSVSTSMPSFPQTPIPLLPLGAWTPISVIGQPIYGNSNTPQPHFLTTMYPSGVVNMQSKPKPYFYEYLFKLFAVSKSLSLNKSLMNHLIKCPGLPTLTTLYDLKEPFLTSNKYTAFERPYRNILITYLVNESDKSCEVKFEVVEIVNGEETNTYASLNVTDSANMARLGFMGLNVKSYSKNPQMNNAYHNPYQKLFHTSDYDDYVALISKFSQNVEVKETVSQRDMIRINFLSLLTECDFIGDLFDIVKKIDGDKKLELIWRAYRFESAVDLVTQIVSTVLPSKENIYLCAIIKSKALYNLVQNISACISNKYADISALLVNYRFGSDATIASLELYLKMNKSKSALDKFMSLRQDHVQNAYPFGMDIKIESRLSNMNLGAGSSSSTSSDVKQVGSF